MLAALQAKKAALAAAAKSSETTTPSPSVTSSIKAKLAPSLPSLSPSAAPHEKLPFWFHLDAALTRIDSSDSPSDVISLMVKNDPSIKCVLVDFFAYSCTNCLRTLPVLRRLHEKYHSEGLRVIGFHRPEFEFEKDPFNMYEFLQRNNVQYTVGLDNDDIAWKAWSVEFWPQHFVVRPATPNNIIALEHFGDRNHHEVEQKIVAMLWQGRTGEALQSRPVITPYNQEVWYDAEFFMGKTHRGKNGPSGAADDDGCDDGVCRIRKPGEAIEASVLKFNKAAHNIEIKVDPSQWAAHDEYIVSTTDDATLPFTLDFAARGADVALYLVAQPPNDEGVEHSRQDLYNQAKAGHTITIESTDSAPAVSVDGQEIKGVETKNAFTPKKVSVAWTNTAGIPARGLANTVLSHPDRHFLNLFRATSQNSETPSGADEENSGRVKATGTFTFEKNVRLYVLFFTTQPHEA